MNFWNRLGQDVDPVKVSREGPGNFWYLVRGEDTPEQIAVAFGCEVYRLVGHLMFAGCRVGLLGEDVGPFWYQIERPSSSWSDVGPVATVTTQESSIAVENIEPVAMLVVTQAGVYPVELRNSSFVLVVEGRVHVYKKASGVFNAIMKLRALEPV